MFENLVSVSTQVAILFAMIALGAVLRRTKLLDDKIVKGFVDVLVVVVTPCLVVHAFQRPFSPDMLKSLGFVALAASIGHVAAIALSYALIHHRNPHTKNVLRLAAVFSNAGFMGIPLEHALLGDTGVFYGVVYIGVFNVFIWSWGLCTVRNVSTKQLFGSEVKSMFVNPGTIGLALGLPFFFLSMRLPEVLGKPVEYMAGLNTPLAMLAIGYYLAGAKAGPIFRTPAAYVAGAFRLVAFPMMIVGALWAFGHVISLDRTMMLALVVSASAPVAALTSMLAARYGSDVDMSAGMVGGTTLLSIATMPPVIALAMQVL